MIDIFDSLDIVGIVLSHLHWFDKENLLRTKSRIFHTFFQKKHVIYSVMRQSTTLHTKGLSLYIQYFDGTPKVCHVHRDDRFNYRRIGCMNGVVLMSSPHMLVTSNSCFYKARFGSTTSEFRMRSVRQMLTVNRLLAVRFEDCIKVYKEGEECLCVNAPCTMAQTNNVSIIVSSPEENLLVIDDGSIVVRNVERKRGKVVIVRNDDRICLKGRKVLYILDMFGRMKKIFKCDMTYVHTMLEDSATVVRCYSSISFSHVRLLHLKTGQTVQFFINDMYIREIFTWRGSLILSSEGRVHFLDSISDYVDTSVDKVCDKIESVRKKYGLLL